MIVSSPAIEPTISFHSSASIAAHTAIAIPEDKIERIKELGVISCDDGELVISRKIMSNRSQIKVNGQSFTSAQTRVLAHELIDIHGQHDNQLLMDESNHLSVIDDYDNSINPLLDSYKECYKEYTICKKAYESLSGDDESRIKEMAFLQYEINELESAALIEPRIIDLPAPVSPESILSPSSKSIFSSSISARFLTCKLTNISCLSILSINCS